MNNNDYIDYLIEKRFGYKKVSENQYEVDYEKYDEDYKFTHRISLLSKASKKHIIQSYDIATDMMCGFEIAMMPLFYRKAKKLSKKYKWNRER